MQKTFSLNIYGLIFSIMVLVAGLTWLLPAGQYNSIEKDGRTYTVAGSTVTFVATTATGSTIKVPDTITVDGKTYPVTAIAPNAFKKSKVKKVTVGSNVVTIGANAWNGCKKLTALTIGKGVTKMGANMCKGAKKLKTITIKSKSLTKAGVKKCLKGSKVKTVKVPKAKVKAYKKIFTKKICGAKVKVKKA